LLAHDGQQWQIRLALLQGTYRSSPQGGDGQTGRQARRAVDSVL
jgi:hypothetical protein